MKRAAAIEKVLEKLHVIKEDILKGTKVSPLDFLVLSEIFKFKIEPKSDRFTATCLYEAAKTNDSKKHLEMLNVVLKEQDTQDIYAMVGGKRVRVAQTSSTSYTPTGTTSGDTTEEEVNELLDFDGSMQSSKIPPGTANVKTLSSKKTTDDVVKATRQAGTWTGAGHYFKRYYGESIEENDLSVTLGFDETQDMDAEETIEYFEKEHDMDTVEAKDRAEGMGKTEKLDKKGDNYQRLTEKEKLKKISEEKVRKMLEVILKSKSNDGVFREQDDDYGQTGEDLRKSELKMVKKFIKLLKAGGIKNDKSLCTKIKKWWNE